MNTDHERELLTLAALAELSPEDALTWEQLKAQRPQLAEEAAEMQALALRLTASAAEMPETVRARLDAARSACVVQRPQIAPHTLMREQRTSPLFRRFTLVALPLAAALTLGFFLLQPTGPDPDTGIKQGPVTFPSQTIRLLAPGAETHLLEPSILWKGTPGKIYDLRLLDSSGQLVTSASGIQSPYLLDQPLTAGERYELSLSETGEGSAAPLVHSFLVHPQATALATDIKSQMESLFATGNLSDALMLLHRLPEGALSAETFAEWKKKLNPP